MDENQIYKQLDKIKEIPTLPTIVFELNQHLQNPETSITKVSETIEKDQAMALKILKLVNSAFYGFRSKVSDVKNAVVLLALMRSVMPSFPFRLSMPCPKIFCSRILK